MVSEAAVDAADGLVGVQVDVDPGVAEGGVGAAVAGDDALVDHDDGLLGNHVDGPVGVDLLGVDILESLGPNVVLLEALSGVRHLVHQS